ncbi:MAG: 50S ribosomal protein L10 [Deltaproteobacteria bacterium]|nr:50S ribosomal protein L10 [Deltaproteobacteria bacterium]
MKSKSKADTVVALRSAIEAQKAAVVAEFRGLTVTEITNLRKKLRGVNAEFKVVKNTLMRLAAKDTDFGQLDRFFEGPTAVALTHGDPVALAKAMKDFAGASPKVRIKAGLFDGRVLEAKDVETLAEVPPREVLLALLAGGLASPISQLAQALSGTPRKLAYALNSIHEQKSKQPEAV